MKTLPYRPIILGALLLLAAVIGDARAEKTGGWQGSSNYVLDWLQQQKQPGSNTSCCGLGDAVNVDIAGERGDEFRLVVTNGRGHLPDGIALFVARDRLVKTNLDPEGNAVAWVSSSGLVYCLSIPPKV
jgi:hypothetical protein